MSDLQKQFSYRGTMILFLHLDDLQKISWTSSGAFLMVLSTVRQPEGKVQGSLFQQLNQLQPSIKRF